MVTYYMQNMFFNCLLSHSFNTIDDMITTKEIMYECLANFYRQQPIWYDTMVHYYMWITVFGTKEKYTWFCSFYKDNAGLAAKLIRSLANGKTKITKQFITNIYSKNLTKYIIRLKARAILFVLQNLIEENEKLLLNDILDNFQFVKYTRSYVSAYSHYDYKFPENVKAILDVHLDKCIAHNMIERL